MSSWRIFKGTGEPHDGITRLPSPPPWREFGGGEASDDGAAAEPLAGDELRLPTSARTLERLSNHWFSFRNASRRERRSGCRSGTFVPPAYTRR